MAKVTKILLTIKEYQPTKIRRSKFEVDTIDDLTPLVESGASTDAIVKEAFKRLKAKQAKAEDS